MKKLTTEEWVEKARATHGDKYDYSKVEYKNYITKVIISCSEHGEFLQRPGHHTRGIGCPKCKFDKLHSINRKSPDDFFKESKLLHGDKYDYSKSVYTGIKDKIIIYCLEHGEFKQTADGHGNRGHGCPKCAILMSKAEDEIANLLSCFYKVVQRHKLSTKKEVDIYLPELNIGIEFNGLRWHSEQFIKNNKYHIEKTLQAKEEGIRLIHIFEDEWLFKKEIVKSRLLNLIGKTPNKIYARKCEIREVSSQDSTKFLDENHIQGKVGSNIKIGLYYNNELVSLMNFSKPRINIGGSKEDGIYELVRFSNKLNTFVIGGASKLLKHFEKTHKPKEIISYADRRWSEGNLYHKLGFDFIHFSEPNYFYVNNNKRENRFKYRKSELVKQGFDENKTEKQIMEEQGFHRIYDCGNMKFIKLIQKYSEETLF